MFNKRVVIIPIFWAAQNAQPLALLDFCYRLEEPLKKPFFPSTPRRGLEMDGDAKTDPFLDKAPKEPETEAIWKPEVGILGCWNWYWT